MDPYRLIGGVFAHESAQIAGLRSISLARDAATPALQAVVGTEHGLTLTTLSLSGHRAPRPVESEAIAGGTAAGLTPVVTQGRTAGGRDLAFVTGSGSTPLAIYDIDADGGIGARLSPGGGARLPEGLAGVEIVQVAGASYVYGHTADSRDPMIWRLAETGAMTLTSTGRAEAPQSGIPTAGLTDLHAPGSHLVAAGTGDAVLSVHAINGKGQPSLIQALRVEDMPGVSGAIRLASAEIAGETYVVVAAQGSSSLTVYRLAATGRLTLTDHVIDTRDSRFDGVSALDLQRDATGAAHLVAGGGDLGASLFRLLPGGRLVQTGTLLDTAETALDGVGGLELHLDAAGALQLATLGLRDQGVSLFELTPDAVRVVADGAGSDTLRGQRGADLFVLGADVARDVIESFSPRLDSLDLSGWAFFRSAAQLEIDATATGAEIRFHSLLGEEVLRLVSTGGGPIDPEDVAATIRATPSRFLPEWLAGDAGPARPEPAQKLSGTTGDDVISGRSGRDVLVGRAGNDRIDGGAGGDDINGGEGADLLMGGADDDTVRGFNGFDTLEGGSGRDTLAGNNGDDEIRGGSEADLLMGGLGRDLLMGGDGDDTLRGDAGTDRLAGEAGRDSLYGNAGTDWLSGGLDDDGLRGGINHDTLLGDAGDDLLMGDPGFDRLEGGSGHDSLYGNAGRDLLFGGDGNDLLEGGINHDTLEGGAGDDLVAGSNGFDRLNGGSGNDSVYGNAGNDTLEGGGGSDLLNGGIGADTFVFRGGAVRIDDFQNDIDTLALDAELWGGRGRTAKELTALGEIVDGDAVFDFGADGRLAVSDMARMGLFLNDIEIA